VRIAGKRQRINPSAAVWVRGLALAPSGDRRELGLRGGYEVMKESWMVRRRAQLMDT
jgi:hypothetical protein